MAPAAQPEPDPAQGVYGITVAAQLVGTGVQNLRAYEARGLLEPERTEGGTRRYSPNDLDRLRRIGDLLAAGLNLAGIAMVMDLQEENNQLLAQRDEQQWLPTAPTTTASIPASSSPEADLLHRQVPLTPTLIEDDHRPAGRARAAGRPLGAATALGALTDHVAQCGDEVASRKRGRGPLSDSTQATPIHPSGSALTVRSTAVSQPYPRRFR